MARHFLPNILLSYLWWAYGKSPCQDKYWAWLSESKDFLRKDQPKHLPGLHVACIWRKRKHNMMHLEIHVNGIRHDDPVTAVLPAEFDINWLQFRRYLMDKLEITKETNSWGNFELKQPYGIFSERGERLLSMDAVTQAKLVFIFECGQWMWPPVRKGFVRDVPGTHFRLETLSLQPLLYRVRGFLEEQECDAIIEQVKPKMVPSTVTLQDKQKAHKEFQTSSQARLSNVSPSLNRIYDRVAHLTRIPVSHNEQVQVLRYDKSQYDSARQDSHDPMLYNDKENEPWHSGHNNRLLTVFWYLTNVSKGGETIFPRADGLPQPRDMWSCEQGLKVEPERAAAILYYNLHPNGNDDKNSLHGACPVIEGEKWAANYWVWNKPQNGSKTIEEGVDYEDDEFDTPPDDDLFAREL